MGQLVLLVVAAAWAAVLVPPLLRSRIENRPNSSVTDFANQLSSLQRAMPPRGVAMRSMARPLAPSPLSRPAAPGRPGLRSGVRTHSGTTSPARTAPARPVVDRTRVYDATPRPRSHGERRAATAARSRNAAQASPRQRAVRARPDRRLLAVPRRHDEGAGLAVVLLRRVHRAVRLRVRPRPVAPARRGVLRPSRSPAQFARSSRSPTAAPRCTATTASPATAQRRRGRPAGRRPSEPIDRLSDSRAHGAVAQLVERNNRTVEARGSIPLSSTASRPSRAVGLAGSTRLAGALRRRRPIRHGSRRQLRCGPSWG